MPKLEFRLHDQTIHTAFLPGSTHKMGDPLPVALIQAGMKAWREDHGQTSDKNYASPASGAWSSVRVDDSSMFTFSAAQFMAKERELAQAGVALPAADTPVADPSRYRNSRPMPPNLQPLDKELSTDSRPMGLGAVGHRRTERSLPLTEAASLDLGMAGDNTPMGGQGGHGRTVLPPVKGEPLEIELSGNSTPMGGVAASPRNPAAIPLKAGPLPDFQLADNFAKQTTTGPAAEQPPPPAAPAGLSLQEDPPAPMGGAGGHRRTETVLSLSQEQNGLSLAGLPASDTAPSQASKTDWTTPSPRRTPPGGGRPGSR